MSHAKDDRLRNAELAVMQIEEEIADLLQRFSTAPPDMVAPDLNLLRRFTKFHLDRIRESLVALNHSLHKARKGELDQDALLALAQWT